MIQKFLTDLIKKKMKESFATSTGLDPAMIDQVDTDAIGSLLTGLTRNAQDGQAGGIFDAITSNHQGEVIKQPDQYDTLRSEKKPEGIINHILGDQTERVIAGIAQKNGIDTKQAMSVLKFVAPLVLGYFGKQKPKDPQQLTNRLEIEQKQIENDTNISFTSLFDQDGDGDLDLNDVMKMIA